MTAITTIDHHQQEMDSIDMFGFWIYIMTDAILFASLFATFIVLAHPGAPGSLLKEHIDLKYVLIETFFLLASNFAYGMVVLGSYRNKLSAVQSWLIITFILGACFVGMELHEFMLLYHEGFTWQTSGTASAFFTLVGTHGLHVSVGLLWILVMLVQLSTMKLNAVTKKRMTYLGLFWNFLDIVWIFVFTIVYLMGAM